VPDFEHGSVDAAQAADERDAAPVSVDVSEAAEAALADVAGSLPEFALPSPDPTVPPRFNSLQLDLEVFQGPFDLLLELVMREEIDLLEVDLAEIVLSYVDLLESRGEIELEPVTEFVVLIAALLELKSRLMLPTDDEEDLDLDLGAEEAADELLARLLLYHRYNRLAGWLRERFVAETPFRYRSAAPPARLRRVSFEHVGKVYDPALLCQSMGALLTEPEPLETPHMRVQRVTLEQRLQVVRSLLRRARSFSFDEAVRGADRLTECMTVFALLELYKLGEATWRQDETFGPIEVSASPQQEAA
jgi:segregation and condensation protein A